MGILPGRYPDQVSGSGHRAFTYGVLLALMGLTLLLAQPIADLCSSFSGKSPIVLIAVLWMILPPLILIMGVFGLLAGVSELYRNGPRPSTLVGLGLTGVTLAPFVWFVVGFALKMLNAPGRGG